MVYAARRADLPTTGPLALGGPCCCLFELLIDIHGMLEKSILAGGGARPSDIVRQSTLQVLNHCKVAGALFARLWHYPQRVVLQMAAASRGAPAVAPLRTPAEPPTSTRSHDTDRSPRALRRGAEGEVVATARRDRGRPRAQPAGAQLRAPGGAGAAVGADLPRRHGVRKVQYGYRVMDEVCDRCEGDGYLKPPKPEADDEDDDAAKVAQIEALIATRRASTSSTASRRRSKAATTTACSRRRRRSKRPGQ